MNWIHGHSYFREDIKVTNATGRRIEFWRIGAMAAMAAMLILAAAYSIRTAAQIVEKPIPEDPVAIDSGLVAGKMLPSGVKAYFGIPYVAAPLRELRWREPQAVKPWKGVYNADRMPPECMQTLRDSNVNHYFGEEAMSEDCLYLNIWAPGSAKTGANLPVVVWIYGGGLRIGSSAMANYSGEYTAAKGALYVSFNYRINAMGFMAHPELTKESPNHASGNYGWLDQVAALKWVQRNIAKFGGDPGRVTIMGQSGGSRSVSALVASPLAKNLFHRALAMSGSVVPNFGQGLLPALKEMEQEGVKLQQALKAPSIAAMRYIAADRIFNSLSQIQFGAEVDGYFLPEPASAIFAKGQQNDVPTILGFTRDESSNALRQAKNLEEYRAAVQKAYGDRAQEFLKFYPAANDAEARTAGADAAREAGMGGGMRGHAVAHAKTGKAPVYLYMFSRVQPYAPGIVFADHDPATAGAYHTGDVPYWFQTLNALNLFRVTRNWTPYDRDLTDKMSNMLISFAKTGDPSAAGVPAWPRINLADERLMEFGDSIRVLPVNSKRVDFITGLAAVGGGVRSGARD
jgi:para-nitrobenzyl esterase